MGKIRKTRDENLLIELRKDSKLEEVSGAIRQALGNELLVGPMVPTITIKLRNLEKTTTEGEIREAFIAALVETAKVLKPGKVRAGWVNATAREKKLVIRCFKVASATFIKNHQFV